MIEDALTSLAHERMAKRQREAELYRQWIDAAPLHFHGPGPFAGTRRSIANALSALADAISP